MAAAVDRLLEAMDALDEDPDLEDGADYEPWMSVGEQIHQPIAWSAFRHDPTEREAEQDDEPSLAAPETHVETQTGHYVMPGARTWPGDGAQTNWARGGRADLEESDVTQEGDVLDIHEGEDTEDREPDVDDEHPLGWGDGIDQRLLHASDDREPSLGSRENVSQLAWGASGNDDLEAEAPRREASAIVRTDDGSATILRTIGDPPKGLAVIRDDAEAGRSARQVPFKRVPAPFSGSGNLVSVAPGIMRVQQ